VANKDAELKNKSFYTNLNTKLSS